MYQHDPQETERFISAMDSLVKARGDADVLAEMLDLSGVAHLLDVGSGPATYPIALCRRWPTLRVTVFDLPRTLTLTRRYVRDAGLEDRFDLIAGNYRTDEISGSYEAIFLSNIIHGEGPEENRKLAEKLARALQPGGRIIIKDHILDATRARPPVGAIFSLLMLLTTESGRCYSLEEVSNWLYAAGLQNVLQIDLPQPLTSSLVIAKK
jgi:SAM-dependent methyltransferase